MKDTQLYLVIGIMASVDLVVMTAWQIFDPFYREIKELSPYVSFTSYQIEILLRTIILYLNERN